MKASILEYLGRYEQGIMTLFAIVYEDEYYECTFYYDQTNTVLTISEEMEAKMGHPINEHPEFIELLKSILLQLVPYNEMYNRLDEMNIENPEN